MTSNLFRAARMNGVILPAVGETIDIDEDSASRLIASKHAEAVIEDEPEVEVPTEPVTPLSMSDVASVETAAVEARETAAADKPRRGRPPKSE